MQQNATTRAYTNQESVGFPPYSYCVLEIFRISYHTDWSKVRFFTHPTISPIERYKDTSFFETNGSSGYVFYFHRLISFFTRRYELYNKCSKDCHVTSDQDENSTKSMWFWYYYIHRDHSLRCKESAGMRQKVSDVLFIFLIHTSPSSSPRCFSSPHVHTRD